METLQFSLEERVYIDTRCMTAPIKFLEAQQRKTFGIPGVLFGGSHHSVWFSYNTTNVINKCTIGTYVASCQYMSNSIDIRFGSGIKLNNNVGTQ